MELFKSHRSGEQRLDHLLKALSHLMQAVPKEVLLAQLPMVTNELKIDLYNNLANLLGYPTASGVNDERGHWVKGLHTEWDSLPHH